MFGTCLERGLLGRNMCYQLPDRGSGLPKHTDNGLDPSSYPFSEPAYCVNSFVDSLCTLRRCNQEYQRLTGTQTTGSLPPELATAKVVNQAVFLARTVQVPGHYKDKNLICMPLTECDSLVSLLRAQEESLYSVIVNRQESKVLDRLSLSSMPLACYTGYACEEECNRLEHKMLGTWGLSVLDIHHTLLMLVGWESHSAAAVRLSNTLVQDQYLEMAKSACSKSHMSRGSGSKIPYLVFACGYYTYCEQVEAQTLWTEVVSGSVGRKNAITCHVYRSVGLMILSDTAGVVLRPDVMGKYGDTLCFNRTGPQVTTHKKPTSDEADLGFHFSAFFQLWPYTEYDRPPCPLLFISLVFPIKCEWPIIMTPLMQQVKLSYEEEGGHEVACIPGGINMSICLANLANTYKNCIGVSGKAAEKGIFSHVDLCSFSLPYNTPVPPKERELTTAEYPWWKGEDRCQHTDMSSTCGCCESMPGRSQETSLLRHMGKKASYI
ncbi:hypothetical protein VP01_1713g1 [Puccinia sorghi]|uniref:Uncharacterized protein n=1 Tax=Puccinia sorghi TaxID=27349 RepID=A0A0L6VHD1_9BASI|nr:hypothetical protein VP01_1713g1 [Puccinia sorghi]